MINKLKQRQYTGDIGTKELNADREYTAATQEIDFSLAQHAIWADLFAAIYQPHFLEHICREYAAGMARLKLDPERIPSIATLNERITPHTGWQVERTTVRYTPADDWYVKFAHRIFW